jgi:hypothetical protein
MSYSSAKMSRVSIFNSEILEKETIFNLKYLGQQGNVCVYQITGSSNDSLFKTGELFRNKTTNEITLSVLKTSGSGRNDLSLTGILTKNGKNNWSGSGILQFNQPVGECAAITKFSFVK